MSAAPAIILHKPETLRQFQEDLETARDELPTAIRGLQAREAERRAKESFRRCRLSMEKAGRALLRMHTTKSWNNDFKTWIALCRHLEVSKQHAHQLMDYAAAIDEVDPKLLADAAPEGLSQRQAIVLHQAPPEERDATLREAAETGNLKAAMANLAQSLQAAPPAEINEGEVPKAINHKRSDAQRNLTKTSNYLDFHGLLDRPMPPIAAPTARAYLEALRSLLDSTAEETAA